MQLSPKVRAVLTVVAGVLAAVAVVLPAITGVPVAVGAVIAAVLAVLAGLGIVPPQTGGTQVGVASPTVVQPPQADVVRAGPLP